MTHTVSYEEILDYMLTSHMSLASSAGRDGHKSLVRVGHTFQVRAGGKLVEEFVTLDAAVRKYNQTKESD